VKGHVGRAVGILLFIFPDHALLAKDEQDMPIHVRMSIILSDPLAGKESDPLPLDIGNMALPVADPKGVCQGLIIMPDIQLVRVDLAERMPRPLVFNDPGPFLGRQPARQKLEESRRKALETIRAGKELVQQGQKAVTLEELAGDNAVKEASPRFVLLSDEANEAKIKKVFSAGSEPIVVKDKNTLYQRLLENLCTGDPEQVKQTASDKNIVVIYKPHLPVEPVVETQPIEPGSKCDQEIISRGMQFVSLAKNANHPKARTEDLENALHLFDQAVAEAAAAGQCSCAKASMNRGVVRGLLKQPKKALEDLQEAERCAPQDVEVLYNLACHYSVYKNQLDPLLESAFDALGKALAAGFKDCKLLREDRDLANLRANRNKFRDTLEEHGLFCK
jgi:tetratricopeptide (TPR) repeat protein